MNRLFGADGIRGVADRFPLGSVDIELLGMIFGEWLRDRQRPSSILMGADTRESSHRIKTVLATSLLRQGVEVVDVGVIPTPGISYLLARKGYFGGGVMISASHNPVEENGIKLFDHRGRKLLDQDESTIEEMFFGLTPKHQTFLPARIISEPDFGRQYANHIVQDFKEMDWSQMHLLVDCANGAAFQVTRVVLEGLNMPFMLLNASPDGVNINYKSGSETTRLSPGSMAGRLNRFGKKIGLAVDGDGDRVVLVDEKGRLYDGDMLLAMLGVQMHEAGQLNEDIIVATAASNSGLVNYLRRYQIAMRCVRNGDKYVTNALIEDDLSLGGEQIGHIIIHDDSNHVTGDGLRTALFTLAHLVSNPGIRLSDLAPGMRKYPQIKAAVHIGRRTNATPNMIPGLEDQLEHVRSKFPDLLSIECRPASTESTYRILMESRQTSVQSLADHAYQLGVTIQSHFNRLELPIQVLDCTTGGCLPRRSV